MTAPVTVTKTITAENTFTDEITLDEGQRAAISIKGSSFTGTVQIQRKLRGQSAFQNVQDSNGVAGFASRDAEVDYLASSSQIIRVGVPTGSMAGTSVTVVVTVGK